MTQSNRVFATRCCRIEYVALRNEEGPLGIHVVPDYDRLGQDRGLLVQGIEPGGRIDQDGRLGFCDRIIEINGHNLLNMPFQMYVF
jgi:partitioning defective protein 3